MEGQSPIRWNIFCNNPIGCTTSPPNRSAHWRTALAKEKWVNEFHPCWIPSLSWTLYLGNLQADLTSQHLQQITSFACISTIFLDWTRWPPTYVFTIYVTLFPCSDSFPFVLSNVDVFPPFRERKQAETSFCLHWQYSQSSVLHVQLSC